MSKSLSQYILIISLIIVALLVGTTMATAATKESESLLARLDSIIANQDNLIKEKEIRIAGLHKTLKAARSDNERLGLTRQLYDEYLVFDSDSALHYAKATRDLLTRSFPDDYDRLTQWKLNEAFIYTVQGLHDTAMQLLATIDSTRLTPEMKSMYFGAMAYLHSMRAVYVESNKNMWDEDIAIANAYRDSIQTMDLPVAPDWLWVPVAMNLDAKSDRLKTLDISALKEYVDSNRNASRLNAINAYWLSRYYEELGQTSEMVKYKTLAAIYDALIVNREIAALQELATFLFENGELNRAYNYLIYTVNQANLYHNRYRMVSLSDVLPTVRDAYRIELEKRDRRLSIFVVILAVLAVVLLGSVIFIIIEYLKIKKMRNLLKEANGELKVSISERDKAISGLETANKELNEANSLKLSLIAHTFKLTAQYISALEDYRKKLLRKYKGKKIDDLGVLINDPELIKEHYQGFYEGFDNTVLSIFPDFIEEYNEAAPQEAKVDAEAIKKSKTLNTRLRIYALRRLGVSKSADIAKMLNVSIRTVYNNKSASCLSEEEAHE